MRAALLALAIGCSSSHDAPPTQPPPASPFEAFDTMSPHPGELAPDFTLADADGHAVKLSEAVTRGPVVLVWGSFT
jgi:hypothetical protein